MQTTTFTEFRNQASHFLNLAEQGEHIIIIRHGKPIAELTPIANSQKIPSWKSPVLPIKNVSLSAEILAQREQNPE